MNKYLSRNLLALSILSGMLASQAHAQNSSDAVSADSSRASADQKQKKAEQANAEQTEPKQKVARLEAVVVTSQRREAELQSVPVAVTALTTEDLNNRQIASPKDLDMLAPSLTMTQNVTAPTNLSPTLRGSSQGDSSSIAAEAPFGIYIDDIYVGRLNGNNLAFNDTSVELLRGPQGTLYGRNSLTGALKITSRTPGKQSWLNMQVSGGNFDQYGTSLSVGGPLSDMWAASLSALYSHKDNQAYNVTTKSHIGLEENLAVRAKVHFMPGNGFDGVGFVSQVKSKNDATLIVPGSTPGVPSNHFYYNSQVVPTFGPYTTATTPLPVSIPNMSSLPSGKTTQTIAGLTLSQNVGSATIKSITGYVKTDDAFTSDFSGDGSVMGGSNVHANQFTEELQMLGTTADGRLNYIAGAYYLHETATQDWGWYYRKPASTSNVRINTNSIALYAQFDYQLTDALTATAGVRRTRDKKSFDASMVQLNPFPGRTDPVSLKNTYLQTTPKFALNYSLLPTDSINSMLLYASAAKGFKSGGYNGIIITNLNDAQTPYGPESNWTYELGLKTDLFDHRLRINAAYFYEKASDIAANATAVVNGYLSSPVQNIGDATIQGLEVEISAAPTDGLTVFLRPTFLHAKYTQLVPGSAPATASAKYGVASPKVGNMPSLAYSVGFDYQKDIPLGSHGGRFLAGMTYWHTTPYATGASNRVFQDPYDRMNAYIGLEFNKDWQVRLSARNLQNRVTNGSSSGLGGFIFRPRRQLLMSVSYQM